MVDYIDPSALKKTLSLDGSTYADDDIDLAVNAASRWVESYCARRFWLDDEPVQRLYSCGPTGSAPIDDLAEVVSVEQSNGVDYQPLTSYQLMPLNAAADLEPYMMITGVSGIIRITGRFGWPALPRSIEQATGLLAARLIKRSREAPFGVAGFSLEGGAVRIAPIDPDVAALLNPYSARVLVG
jgi:hypothetical protein